jgi:hypothetical protein
VCAVLDQEQTVMRTEIPQIADGSRESKIVDCQNGACLLVYLRPNVVEVRDAIAVNPIESDRNAVLNERLHQGCAVESRDEDGVACGQAQNVKAVVKCVPRPEQIEGRLGVKGRWERPNPRKGIQ